MASKRETLEAAGFFVGDRDPKRNTAHAGRYMVCANEDINRPASPDAEGGHFCIVGDDLDELITEAHEYLIP